jgi:hypothetical protein
MVFITIVITGANLNQLISWGPHIVGKILGPKFQVSESTHDLSRIDFLMISATSLVLGEFLTLEIRDIGRHCTGQGFMTAHAQPKLHLCFFPGVSNPKPPTYWWVWRSGSRSFLQRLMLQTLRWTIFNPVFNLTPCSGWCCCQLPCGGHGSWSWSLVGLVSWFLVKSPQERERDLRAISCTNQIICPSTITKYKKWWYITHQWQVLCFSNNSSRR